MSLQIESSVLKRDSFPVKKVMNSEKSFLKDVQCSIVRKRQKARKNVNIFHNNLSDEENNAPGTVMPIKQSKHGIKSRRKRIEEKKRIKESNKNDSDICKALSINLKKRSLNSRFSLSSLATDSKVSEKADNDNTKSDDLFKTLSIKKKRIEVVLEPTFKYKKTEDSYNDNELVQQF